MQIVSEKPCFLRIQTPSFLKISFQVSAVLSLGVCGVVGKVLLSCVGSLSGLFLLGVVAMVVLFVELYVDGCVSRASRRPRVFLVSLFV